MNQNNIKSALAEMQNGNLLEKSKDLLSTLGYRSDLTLELSGTVNDFFEEFPAQNPNTKTEQHFRDNAESAQIIFQFTKDEIVDESQLSLLEPNDFDNGNTQCFLFCAVELKDNTYSRTKYAEFTREINKRFFAPTVIIFRAGESLTIAFANRRTNITDESRDVLGQVTLIKDILLNHTERDPHRAHLDILSNLSLEQCIKWMDDNRQPKNFDGLLAAWLAKLDTEELNKQFYRKLFTWYEWAVETARFPTEGNRVIKPEEHVIRLITRLLFIWFIKEKGLVADELFNNAQIQELLVEDDFENGDSYYRAVLQNLFFATLNTEIDRRKFSTEGYSTNRDFSRYRYKAQMEDPNRLLKLFAETPFINGGLFDCLDSWEATGEDSYRVDCFSDNQYHGVSIPNRLFFDKNGLIPLLEHYKFTVEENTPIDQEVALDPELLGRVFENLLAAYNPETGETARKQTGSYYTPRAIVDYMVEEALVASLSEKCQPIEENEIPWEERLHYLFDYAKASDDASEWFNDNEIDEIVRTISELKILDPAVGSGAFPMGVLHKLTLALRRLDPDNTRWEALQKELAGKRAADAFDTQDDQERREELHEIDDTFKRYRDSDFGRKLYLIQNSIFGVDIQPIACQIAKLRFFISLAIEQESDIEAVNFGIKPLPNLETRFIAANTLIGFSSQRTFTNQRVVDLERELRNNREQHFHATTRQKKRRCKEEDERLRAELGEELQALGMLSDEAEKIAQWDIYDQNASADWFDPEWMFGNTDGFDIVIGNPPYISHDKIPNSVKTYIKNSYESYQAFADLYCYFLESTLKLQAENGVVSFITSNSYLKAEYGTPIRKFLHRHNILMQMINVEGSQVFESAIVNVAIIMFRKSSNATNDSCIVVNSPFSGKDFTNYVKNSCFEYPQSYFNSKSWNLAKPKLVELQKKLETSGKTLQQLGTKIRLGIATGSNDAFLIDQEKKVELCTKNQINAEIIKPVLRGRDISRYIYTLSGEHIILAKNGVNVENDYPDIYQHFDSFGDKFKNRGAQGQHWTNLRACSFYEDFKKEKIVWIELSDFGRFSLCHEEVYLLNSAYFLLPPNSIDSKFLLGILNSKTIHFYLRIIAETSGMGVSRWINNYVKDFPIPAVQQEQQNSIISFVDQILAAKQANPDADTSDLENEIDKLVYALYDLTNDEIAIVEGSV